MRQLSSMEVFLLLVAACLAFSNEVLGQIMRALLITYAALSLLTFVLPPWSAPPLPLSPTVGSFVMLSGCTSGLGLDMVRLFAARGWSLVLLGRDQAKLLHLQKELRELHPSQEFEVLVQDLAAPLAAENVVQKLRDMEFDVDGEKEAETETSAATEGTSSSQSALSKKKQRSTKFIDILVNNAGFGTVELFLSTALGPLQSMISLHVTSTTTLCHLLLPGMLRRGRGRVVNVASMIGFLPSPRAAVYGATKAFLVSFTESLAYEISLRVDAMTRSLSAAASPSSASPAAPAPNLAVVLVAPGATRTQFAATASAAEALVFRLPFLADDSLAVSETMVQGILAGTKLVQPGLLTSWIAWVAPKFPSKIGQFACFCLWGSGQFNKDFLAAEGQKLK